MNEVLTEWPSQHFYDGLLKAVAQVAHRRVEYPTPPTRLAHILDPEAPKVFWDLGHHNNTVYSQKEAYAVVDLITTLLACGVTAEEIGVVAPYRAQGRLIRNLLREYVPETAVRRQLITDTVERMQGQERDLIILSLTTSNPGFAANVAEFFFQPQRLNVAITRPRKKLIIVGSRFVLNAQPNSGPARDGRLVRQPAAKLRLHPLHPRRLAAGVGKRVVVAQLIPTTPLQGSRPN
jgi:DNA replication ATP-dependent helicase Dna2